MEDITLADKLLETLRRAFVPFYDFQFGWLVELIRGPRTIGSLILGVWILTLFYLVFSVALCFVFPVENALPSPGAPVVVLAYWA